MNVAKNKMELIKFSWFYNIIEILKENLVYKNLYIHSQIVWEQLLNLLYKNKNTFICLDKVYQQCRKILIFLDIFLYSIALFLHHYYRCQCLLRLRFRKRVAIFYTCLNHHDDFFTRSQNKDYWWKYFLI